MILDNNCTMYEYIQKREQGKEWEAMSFQNVTLTREEFYRDVDKNSAFLLSMGLKRGDNIAICLPNIPSAIMAFYGANRLGIAVNLIHPLSPPLGLEKMLTNVQSKAIYIMDIFYNQYRKMLDKLGIICVICSAKDYLNVIYRSVINIATGAKIRSIKYADRIYNYRKDIKSRQYSDTNIVTITDAGEENAVFIHSGGTTGSPKTAMLPNRAVNECAYSIASIVNSVQRGQSMLMVLPMFHIFGLGVCMHSALYLNVNIILVPSFRPKAVAKLIRKHRVTYATGVPSMYRKLLNEKQFRGEHLRDMVCCYSGGDKLDLQTKEAFDSLMAEYGSQCTLCEGYGLTEAGIVTVNVKETSRLNSVGEALGRLRIGIVDQTNTFLANGERGEICISGDNLMSGYYGDTDTTDKVLFDDESGNRWVRSGDCGYIDESGHLYFTDRIKRMFKISGINVFPSEIERIVTDNIHEVDKCCAVQYNIDGKKSIKLYVTLKSTPRSINAESNCIKCGGDINSPKCNSCVSRASTEVLKNAIFKAIKDRLMKYSLPKAIIIVDKLPLTAIGKVDYKVLQDKETSNGNQ